MTGVRKLVWGWAVAAAVGGGAVAQPPAPKKDAPDAVRAADPLGALIAEGRSAYARVRDYSCVFTRQERINGTPTAEQVGELKARVNPASVHIRFARPETAAGLEAAYVSTRVDGKVKYKPAGAKGQNGFQTLAPTDPKIAADFRHPIAEYGIGPILDLLANVAAREKTLNNPVEVFVSDFQFAGKNVTRYDVYTRRPHALRYAHRTLVFVDKETKLPVRLEAYDTPKPGAATGELLEAYSFSDLKLNVGLGDSAFDL